MNRFLIVFVLFFSGAAIAAESPFASLQAELQPILEQASAKGLRLSVGVST